MFNCTATYNYGASSSTPDTVDYACDDIKIHADSFAIFSIFFAFILFFKSLELIYGFLRKK